MSNAVLEPFLFNMLNVRYYLGHLNRNIALAPTLKKIASPDLNVPEFEHVWPGAFFTHRLIACDREEESLRAARGGGIALPGWLPIMTKGDNQRRSVS